jgi:DNA polymerase III gamma/tau subunit
VSEELYKKYRPRTLKEIVGQGRAVKILGEFFRNKNLPHCTLISGPSGCGKSTLVEIIADHLECHDLQKTNSANFRGIDTAREIIRSSKLRPLGGRTKVFLLEEFHACVKAMQEALLDVFENPPEDVYFVLATTDPEKLVRAVRTRVTEVKLTPIADQHLFALLSRVVTQEKVVVTERELNEVVKAAGGSARKALVDLEMVLGIEGEKERIQALRSGVSNYQAVLLCRALLDSSKPWGVVAEILKGLEEEPEAVRLAVLGYANKVLLGGGDRCEEAFRAIRAFSEPFFHSGKAGLAAACWLARKKS